MNQLNDILPNSIIESIFDLPFETVVDNFFQSEDQEYRDADVLPATSLTEDLNSIDLCLLLKKIDDAIETNLNNNTLFNLFCLKNDLEDCDILINESTPTIYNNSIVSNKPESGIFYPAHNLSLLFKFPLEKRKSVRFLKTGRCRYYVNQPLEFKHNLFLCREKKIYHKKEKQIIRKYKNTSVKRSYTIKNKKQKLFEYYSSLISSDTYTSNYIAAEKKCQHLGSKLSPTSLYFLKYIKAIIANGITISDFANKEYEDTDSDTNEKYSNHSESLTWHYQKNTRQNLNKMPIRHTNSNANYYEPFVVRTKITKNVLGLETKNIEGLCPYCSVSHRDKTKNYSKQFFDMKGTEYECHLAYKHGVYPSGLELPQLLVYEYQNKPEGFYCPECKQLENVSKYLSYASYYEQATGKLNWPDMFHNHCMRNHAHHK